MTGPGRAHHQRPRARPPARARVPLKRLFRVASIACGVQFGWALQLSLLTPYVQELGIPHAWASLVWLCGPLSGLIVQPLVGHVSDRCSSRYGRRRPFIAAGAAAIVVAVLIIGYSADIGWLLGDGVRRPRAIVAFVIGFWLLDVANNVMQGPCRALLADLTGKDHRRTRIANAYFSLFMALGNILGFATGSYSGWHAIFPFTTTSSCSINCANLKSAFLLDIVLLVITTFVSISAVQEQPLNTRNTPECSEEPQLQLDHSQEAFLWELLGSFRYLSLPIWIVLIVTALTWIGWFPFLLFDTDWMGREIYRGKPGEGQNYHTGVRMGAFGLMLNSVMLGLTSLGIEKMCRKWGAGLVWGVSNILMSICFVTMLIISAIASNMDFSNDGLPPDGIVIAALVVFAVLGVPLAITYTVPYAMISTYTESLGLGQGLSMGVLNLAIVIPQMIVSLGSGPWDQLFGGGNSPAFSVAAVAAFASGLVAILALPRRQADKPRTHH
ncbi:sucrose transport protein SUT2 [Magnolia sinica]|uniref:sucrose transport protein SUT2 n=1 Tax=Magnolia sinica TaxID=86752 RepID=UPI002657CB6A|nr:sucrose transport protein SUT2 [Magnolia sinica]XP_058069562.1 sucrose transport protein SUT2 [Magnolia sinica]XP_058069563.1 sucrose transport protein SUT2 [Magnolia sinica]XP_058069565.1 sucrose transport protein SUT2 [Magnolia sinica]XP_058069566.1 sucrose transport protein SUT2 [Magnolia sinica]XP_058069567.1 sucrose transport protein SUT2 [Magnolia sinica]